MFCNRCGVELPEDSRFCIKCGNTLNTIETSTELEVDNIIQNECILDYEGKIGNEKSDGSALKPKIIIFVVVAFVAISLLYLFNYTKSVDASKRLYSKGEYKEAVEELKSYFPIGMEDSKFFKQANIVNKCQRNIDFFEMYALPKYGDKDMESALGCLVDGYEICKENEEIAAQYDAGYKIAYIKDYYLTNLNEYYGISKEKVEQIIDLDYFVRQDEIGKLYKKGDTKSNQIEKEQLEKERIARNPLEFSDLHFASNSSYTILEGTVTNISENPLAYIRVKGLFKDSSGIVLDTGWTYAVGSEGLSAKESSKFSISVKYDTKIEKASVEIID